MRRYIPRNGVAKASAWRRCLRRGIIAGRENGVHGAVKPVATMLRTNSMPRVGEGGNSQGVGEKRTVQEPVLIRG